MKLDIIFHYNVNETTGEIVYIGKEEIKVDTKKASTSKKVQKQDNSTEPIVILEPNKLVLNSKAVEMLQVCEDCRVDIKYGKKDKKSIPLIGTDAAFGTKSGNRLTKSNTVSYRGANNTKLASYGTTFKLEPTENEGIYYLIGDKKVEEPSIPEEIVNIENELDIEPLDSLDVDSDNLEKFDFTL